MNTNESDPSEASGYFADPIQHLLAELERIDLLVRAQILRARQIYETDPQFQGLYVSEEEVDFLLSQSLGMPRWAAGPVELSSTEIQEGMARIAEAIDRRRMGSYQRGIRLPLDEAARLFRLSAFERDILLVCLAPELDLRYERLYAYLQDDVTRKRPTVDLALNLLSPSVEVKLAGRRFFEANAPLRRRQLVHLLEDSSQQGAPLLSKYLTIDERIVSYLFGSQEIDKVIRGFTSVSAPQTRFKDLVLPADIKQSLALAVERLRGSVEHSRDSEPIVFLSGPRGVGKQATAGALCRELGRKLEVVDGHFVMDTEYSSFESTMAILLREASLQGAVLYWTDFDLLLAEEREKFLRIFLQAIARQSSLCFVASEAKWISTDELKDRTWLRIDLPLPAYGERLELWGQAANHSMEQRDLAAVAAKFRLTGGQIRVAAATAQNLARWRDPSAGKIGAEDLYAACREQSNQRLGHLARKITPHYGWEDIVLPADRIEQLREVTSSIKHRGLVHEVWGFARKLALGKGVNVLFVGPSGTGKTMAAEILAADMGIDLYKVDLSTVVSKYVGETEKNLSRIFAEGETSNAILFFDEADALFGRRSEVHDAHDRYANVETSYLLQRMEEYEGVVILATNLRKNMDEAFVRRVHFTVEFPSPNERDRRHIWEQIWPCETPLCTDIDLNFMAKQFELSGGNIRNIALAASFLAAENGGLVKMEHLIHATRREYQKMGKVVSDGDFGHYAISARAPIGQGDEHV